MFNSIVRSTFLLSCVFVYLPMSQAQEAGDPNSVWIEETFEDFSDGHFDSSGANLYVSASGTIQIINRWDVNMDGYMDFYFGNTHDINHTEPVWVYYKDQSEPASLTSRGAYSLATADINGDGYSDLVIGNRDNNVSDNVSALVYWGGPHGFSDTTPLELPAHAVSGIAIADLNGDDRPDIVIANESEAVSFIYWNSPDGISARERTDLATENASAVAVADLNDDGRVDVIFANGNNAGGGSYIYWGDGKNFSTTSHPLVLETNHPVAVTIGDLNVDGSMDIVFANTEPNETTNVNAYIYWGDGSSYSNDSRSQLSSGSAADVALADFDENGYPDLIFASAGSVGRNWEATPVSTRSMIFWGDSDGYSAGRTTQIPTYAATSVIAGDYDADGRPDIVFTQFRNEENYETDSLVFLNKASGLDLEQPLKFMTRGARDVVMADFSGDGKHDLAFANQRSGNAKGTVPSFLYLGSAEGYSASNRIDLPSSGANQATITDFNDDGWTDVLVDNSDHDDVSLQFGARMFWGDADGINPDRATRIDVDSPWGSSAADFNRDGYLDIVFSTVTPGVDSLFVYWGGDEPYARDRRTVLSLTDGRATAVADLNADGYLDIVGTSVGESIARIYWGGSAGFSNDRYQSLPGLAPVAVEIADLDADGYMDVILCNFWDPVDRHFGMPSYVYWGGPSGYSTAQRTELLTYAAHDAAVADLNKDGHLDILFSNYRTDDRRDPPAYVYWGGDDGFDQRRRSLLPSRGSAGILLADMNRDGELDLVFANHSTNQGNHYLDSQILWGSATGLFSAEATWLPGIGPHNMHVVDVGNRTTRQLQEEYVSSAHRADDAFSTVKLSWEGETLHGTELHFQIRTAQAREDLSNSPWIGSDGAGSYADTSGMMLDTTDEQQHWLQYRVLFKTPDGGNSPLLKKVELSLR